MNIKVYLQNRYHYTNYQIQQLQWFFLTLFSEISKIFLLFFYFYYFKQITFYLWALVVFWIMRFNGGGLHCKTYWGCFLFSSSYMIFAIQVLPNIPFNKIVYILLLIICMGISIMIGPVPSKLKKHLSNEKLSCYKICLFQIELLYCILMIIIPENQYLIIGFWIIMIHTLQMGIAYIRR